MVRVLGAFVGVYKVVMSRLGFGSFCWNADWVLGAFVGVEIGYEQMGGC